MANGCLRLCAFVVGCVGWIGLLIATATNDWVFTCKYGMNTCIKMDELGAKGLWTESYMQTSRTLMVIGSILGLPALALVLLSLPCINLGNESESGKNKQSVLGGVLLLIMAICGIVSTVWFPIGAHYELGLMSFGFSLYAGWVGSAFCLLGGCMTSCCSSDPPAQYAENRFYYSKQGTVNTAPASANHAKSAHV
ncbi:claudin-11-like [Scleropages formosus]|uniref:Claudin-11-like n=1 Tax=Scleropages formosus TaxID=113540 RepID=A0A0P7UHK9_SCLFO|nr:claudin-11-like [Scleropages formosus]